MFFCSFQGRVTRHGASSFRGESDGSLPVEATQEPGDQLVAAAPFVGKLL